MSSFTDIEYLPTTEELEKMRDEGHVRPPFFERLPLVRHFLAVRTCYRINKHYSKWVALGSIPWGANYEYKICNAIWNNLLLEVE